eukprot:UN26063
MFCAIIIVSILHLHASGIVKLQGLKTRPELNGKKGLLLTQTGKRQQVKLDDSTTILVKPENYERDLCPVCSVWNDSEGSLPC